MTGTAGRVGTEAGSRSHRGHSEDRQAPCHAVLRIERLEELRERLAQLTLPEIVQFQVWLHRVRRQINTRAMWGAAELILDGFCSDDSSWYFQVLPDRTPWRRLRSGVGWPGRLMKEWSNDGWSVGRLSQQ
ncbi:DUF4240 domain-containing protein [Streptomyces sp. NPDC051644]|uniref:DUF4240 domain-containing protein n=1 Tax=Streptomyces sp. NPDC051644 TaxID=3365666 RepID=UPI00379206B1